MGITTFSDSDSESDTNMTDNSVDVAVSDQNKSKLPNTKPIPDFISEPITKALKEINITSLFEVQHSTIDFSISGLDLIVQARTGSGKTMAFALPTVERLFSSKIKIKKNQPRVLVLAPTRELAVQINKVFDQLCKFVDFESVPVYGGASYYEQKKQLQTGKAGIVVGTPGRVKDMVNNGYMDLSKVKVVILDEVDRMLDMGFAEDVEEILSFAPYFEKKKDGDEEDKETQPKLSSKKPQTLFYSATCPQWVSDKAMEYMTDDYQHVCLVDETMNIGGTSKTVEHLSVKIDRFEGVATCVRDLVRLYSAGRANGRAIVFTKTKQEANDLALGDVSIGDAQVMHGDIEQRQREVTLKGFREGKFRCLVATDVAARGLDIPQIDLVVQTSPPLGGDIESYVHRSGRTGRAGKKGVCVCIYNFKNKRALRDIEKATGVEFRDIPIPQPIDVAKSVIAEKIDEEIKTVVTDEDKKYENFDNLSENFINEICGGDSKKAVSALLTYIAQGGENLNSRSMLSGAEGFQTWLLETDNSNVRSPVGLIKSILSRNGLNPDAIAEIKTWRQYSNEAVAETKLKGAGVAFDLKEEFTAEVLEAWPSGEKKRSGRETVILKKCGLSLPKLQDFKSKFGDKPDFRGGRGGFRGGQKRPGGFQNRGGKKHRRN